MKILHVTEAYGGGVLRIVNQLAIGCVENGHDVTLAVSVRPEAPPDWARALPPKVKVVELPLCRNLSPLTDCRGLLSLVQLFRREAPDIIHLHSSKAGFLGRLAARVSGHSKTTFYSPHAFAYLSPELSRPKRYLYRALEQLGNAFGGALIACSEDEAEEARELGVCASFVNNGIQHTDLWRLVSDVVRLPSSTVTVMTAGRLCSAKRPEVFVAIAEELRQRGVLAEFVWIGGGGAPPGTTAVSFTGWLPHENVLKVLRTRADIYLQTSSYEGLPVAVLEAQALGVPAVVANAVGNRSAVKDGETGLVLDGDSIKEFADKVESLVVDKQLRIKMGHAARERSVREFSNEAMVNGYLNHYAEAHASVEGRI